MVEFNTSTAPPVVPSAESGSRSGYSTANPMQTGAPSTMLGHTAHKSSFIEKAKEKLGNMRNGDKRPHLGQIPVAQAPMYQGSGYQGPITQPAQMPVTQMSATQVPTTTTYIAHMLATEMPATEMPATPMPATYVQETHMHPAQMPAAQMLVTNMPATQVPMAATTVVYKEQVTEPLCREMKILENMREQFTMLCSSITNWKGLVGDHSRYMASFSAPSTNTAWCLASTALKRAGDEMCKLVTAMDVQIVTPLVGYREKIDSQLNDLVQRATRAKDALNQAYVVKLQAENDTKAVHMTEEEKIRRHQVRGDACMEWQQRQDEYDTLKNDMAYITTCMDKVLQTFAIFFMEIQREYYEKCVSLMSNQETHCRQVCNEADHDNYHVENAHGVHNSRPYENGYSITAAHTNHGRNSMSNSLPHNGPSFRPPNSFMPAHNQSGIAPHNTPFAPVMMHNGDPTLMSYYPSAIKPPAPTQSSPKPMANISEPMDYPVNRMNRGDDVKRSKRAYDHDLFRNGSGNHMQQMHPEHTEKNMVKSTRSRTPPPRRSATPDPFSPYKSDGEYEDAKSEVFGPSRTFLTTTFAAPAGDLTHPMSAGRSEFAQPMMATEHAPEMTKPTMVTEQGMTKPLPGAVPVMAPIVASTTKPMSVADDVPIMSGAPEMLTTKPSSAGPKDTVTPMASMDPSMNVSGGKKNKKNSKNR